MPTRAANTPGRFGWLDDEHGVCSPSRGSQANLKPSSAFHKAQGHSHAKQPVMRPSVQMELCAMEANLRAGIESDRGEQGALRTAGGPAAPESRGGPAGRRESELPIPPYVIRGVKWQPGSAGPVAGATSMSVGLDWLRVRGPRSRLEAARQWITSKFGSEFELRKGPHFFEHAERWASGAQIWYSEPGSEGVQPYGVVELPGSCLGLVSAGVRVKWLRELRSLGFTHVTRLDVAVDWFGEGLTLVQAVRAACERGELCGARKWEPISKYDGRRLVGETVYLGTRSSDGSGRFARCYDKGLETGERPAGTWQRFEVQFMQESARVVAGLLLQADDMERGDVKDLVVVEVDGKPPVPGWGPQAVAVCLGSYDFRVPGKTDRHLRRRPRAGWWASVLGAVEGFRVKSSARRETTLPRFVAYLNRQVGPTLAAIGKITGMEVDEVFRDLVAGGSSIKPKRCSRVALEYNLREYQKQLEALRALEVA